MSRTSTKQNIFLRKLTATVEIILWCIRFVPFKSKRKGKILITSPRILTSSRSLGRGAPLPRIKTFNASSRPPRSSFLNNLAIRSLATTLGTRLSKMEVRNYNATYEFVQKYSLCSRCPRCNTLYAS